MKKGVKKKEVKQVLPHSCFPRKNTRGQVTIFIIVAIVIVVAGLLVYFVYPKIKAGAGFDSKNPSAFIQTCLEDEIKNNAKIISSQGGSLNPKLNYSYDNSKIEYLCYTNQDYLPCVMQQPMLKQHIEEEIKNSVENQTKTCFNELKANYVKQGENPNLVEGNLNVELLPGKIIFTSGNVLTLSKTGSERYENFKIVLNNNLYELVGIANSILEWEVVYGDADTSSYMNYYPNLKVEKKKQEDGTKVYILTERDTKNKFQFATRSMAWPSGYGEVLNA